MNNRRKLLIALGAGALAAPLGTFAQQQGKVWRVGFLATRRVASLDTDTFGAFPRGIRELGYVEGKNLVIEWRSLDGKMIDIPVVVRAEKLLKRFDAIKAREARTLAAMKG
jgi:putative ABC transport system substrate-binding protein